MKLPPFLITKPEIWFSQIEAQFALAEMSIRNGRPLAVRNKLLLKLWIRCLPKTILVAITTSGKEDVNDILEIADKIWETYQPLDHYKNYQFILMNEC
ncbi:uncharacterized protein LOC111691860 [Anoplophora glabripennis]|uniref:uncharacterized protein LOC111691860 n=1 Tax=Anoplophora glabripennis TaxID=217634 RepID=UPI000C779AA5|nr:uncharacterized protein LOC111691860 [Anoplophora glabripennis]